MSIAIQACFSLLDLNKECSNCYACGLHRQGHHVVFGKGNENAEILFIGEAPGYHEDIDGIPFTGRAGILLDKIIKHGFGMKTEEVYIVNVLKCRPPENRDPSPNEVKKCSPWLDKQIEMINPKVIVTLGKYASQHVLDMPGVPMGKMRGMAYNIKGRKVVPTWHPAFLLRQPDRNKETWQDIQLVLNELNLPIPGKSEN